MTIRSHSAAGRLYPSHCCSFDSQHPQSLLGAKADFEKIFEKTKLGLLQAYNERPTTQPFRNALVIGKFCQWLSRYGEENHQLIFNVIRNKDIRVNEGDWTTCAEKDIPVLHAWETLPG
ncbi:hypothetical protein COLO4_13253 [Corchorus olitorius]|uniref:Uncharacterized protein n=1 Tax=Corchorus olitorius TaxID=93759 RepID=A0A1R3JXF9_9ROSI|nr:hypothetical protein COLO4_13253 [Corchorus olitorius]